MKFAGRFGNKELEKRVRILMDFIVRRWRRLNG
jgi:hypothetical protein